ncbi:MAG: CbiX/SirB N-terminal domain-containing protein [Candidatus Thorarchaeota archaeon]
MKTVVVLAMHGTPPKGFPEDEISELFRLHSAIERMPLDADNPMKARYQELDSKIRSFKRTPSNDPYWDASSRLAEALSKSLRWEVIVGFNEFCAPSIETALDEAASGNPDRIIVVTPMMTPGGEHSEIDIPKAIEKSKERSPNIDIIYAWPFDVSQVADFLALQIKNHL